MRKTITLSWIHAWLILVCVMMLGVGATHFYYHYCHHINMAMERGIYSIAIAVLLPSFVFFILWLDKKYPSRKNKVKNGG